LLIGVEKEHPEVKKVGGLKKTKTRKENFPGAVILDTRKKRIPPRSHRGKEKRGETTLQRKRMPDYEKRS